MSIKIQGPIEFDMKVSIINADGVEGVATIGVGLGRFPAEDDMRAMLASFAEKAMPDGFRLMTKREWFNSKFGQCREEDDEGGVLLMNYSMPGGDNWDA